MISKQNDPARQRHYKARTEAWLEMRSKDKRAYVPVGRARLATPTLDVSIKPELGLRVTSGAVEVVKLYLKAEPLTQDAARASLRIMTMHEQDLYPGASMALLDVRRQRWYRIAWQVWPELQRVA